MKIKLLFVLALFAFALSASAGFAQTVLITPKKTVYTRKIKSISKEKRTFSVTYPVISGAISPAAKKNLENGISYWKIFETTLAENLTEYDSLIELFYKVNYNKNGILEIALTQETSAAYPDSQTIDKVFDLKTGKQAVFSDVFKYEAAPVEKFAKMVNQKLSAEKKSLIQRIDKGEFGTDDKEGNDSVKEQINGLEFTKDSFNEYSVRDKGVTILFDAGFPHLIQAAQPDGRYFFTWAEVKPFVKPDGLLGVFVR